MEGGRETAGKGQEVREDTAGAEMYMYTCVCMYTVCVCDMYACMYVYPYTIGVCICDRNAGASEAAPIPEGGPERHLITYIT